MNKDNAKEIIQNHDILIDGSDNIPTRYILDDYCKDIGIPWVHASIHRFEGQIACFNISDSLGYRDLFPDSSPQKMYQTVLKSVYWVYFRDYWNYSSNSSIKICLGIGSDLRNKVLLVDTKTMNFRTMSYGKQPEIISEKPKNVSTIDVKNMINEGWIHLLLIVELKEKLRLQNLKM